MARLIDAEQFDKKISLIAMCWSCSPCLSKEKADLKIDVLKYALRKLSEEPTVDAVEVVRCKECRDCEREEIEPNYFVFHCYKYRRYVDANDFCSDGAKMDGGDKK